MPVEQTTFLPRSINLPVVLDWVERAVAATFFSFFALRFLNLYLTTGIPVYLLVLFSECLVIGFILVRRSTGEVSLRPGEWFVAVAGTIFPLLVAGGGEPLVPSSISALLMLGGLAINVWAKLSLRRSFGIIPANRGVKTRGPYNFVRHPMYFGYFTTQVGFFLSSPTLWNLAVYAAALTLQILRIRAEERTLFQDQTYKTYAAKVRYRLIPGVF